jgi:hypothetical protein
MPSTLTAGGHAVERHAAAIEHLEHLDSADVRFPELTVLASPQQTEVRETPHVGDIDAGTVGDGLCFQRAQA